MKFDLDAVFVEHGCADSALATRILRSLPRDVPVTHVADAREATRPESGARDPFGAGKRRLVIARRKTPFLMPCPAGSAKFACCGYLVLTLASNCPMDCSYCFLQEYLADNPAFQVYANFTDSFDELDRLSDSARGRSFRVGTGELADSLAFDSITGTSRDLIEFFSTRETLTLELKTKTDEIENLLSTRSARARAGLVDVVAGCRLSKLGASHRLARCANRGGARRARRRLPCRVPFRSAGRVSRCRARLHPP